MYLLSSPSSLGPQTLAALLRHALDLSLVAVALAGAASAGRRALRAAGALPNDPAWFGWVCGLVAGEAAWSLSVWLLVAGGLCQPLPCAALWLFLAAAAWRDRRELARLVPPAARGTLAIAACAVTLACLLLGAIAAGAPPTDWDTLVYHFALPKLYLAQGGFHRLPWSVSAHFPLNAEMLYAWALALRGDEAAQWLSWLHGPLLLVVAAAWASGGRSSTVGWVTAALLAATPAFCRVLGTGKNDLQTALAVTATIGAALEARRRPSARGAARPCGAPCSCPGRANTTGCPARVRELIGLDHHAPASPWHRGGARPGAGHPRFHPPRPSSILGASHSAKGGDRFRRGSVRSRLRLEVSLPSLNRENGIAADNQLALAA